MAFLGIFKESAKHLKDVRCITVTALFIALDLVLKQFCTIELPFTKISVAFLAIASIGMLYGPVVAMAAGTITDVLGYFITTQKYAFNPIFTVVELTGGLIYGLFLYKMTTEKIEFSDFGTFVKSVGSNWKSFLRILLAKITVIVICNLLMNTTFQVIAGTLSYERATSGIYIIRRITASAIKLPFEVLLLLMTLYPINAAYKAVFKKINKTA